MTDVVADLTALYRYRVGPGFIGHSVYVTSEAAWYEALFEGEGSTIWQARVKNGQSTALAGVQAYTRVFDCDDTDVALAAHSAAINFGSALPTGAVVLGVIADVTEDFSDGGASTFSADVGVSGGDDDLFTPTALDIDNGVALYTQSVAIAASGTQLAVTISGSVNLSTLTTGTMTLTVLFCVPTTTTIAAP